MKWIVILLTALTTILAVLYLIIGGMGLAIALGTIGLTAIIMTVFSLGIWYAHKSIQLGAKLAIEAQNVNDQWDSVKMKSLSSFGSEIFKLAKSQGVDIGFPPMLESDTIDASFTIQGIDEDMDQ